MRFLITAIVTSLLLAASGAASADTATTNVTFEVTSGALSLTQDTATNVTLAPGSGSIALGGGGTVTGVLHPVTISDSRGGITNNTWSVTVESTGFTTGEAAPTDYVNSIGGSAAAAYFAGANILTNTTSALTDLLTFNTMAVVFQASAGTPAKLDPAGTLLTGATYGSAEMTFTPTLDITVPANAMAGTYTGVVTFTAG